MICKKQVPFFLTQKVFDCTASPQNRIPRKDSRRLALTEEKTQTPRKQAKKKINIISHTITEHYHLITIIIYAQLQCNSSLTSPAFHEVFLAGLIKFSRILLDI